MNSKLLRTIIIFIGLFMIIVTLKSIYDLWRAGDQVTAREKEVAELKAKNDNLQRQLAEVETPSYLEKVARDKLNLTKPGEYVVILPKSETATSSAASVDSRPNWQKWKEIIF